jgi:hypothetical protein
MGRTTTQGIGRTEAAGGPAERAAAAGAADLGQWCAAGPRNLSLSVELGRAMLEMHRRLVDVGRETICRQQDAAMAEMARALADVGALGSAAGGGANAELARAWVEAVQTVAAAATSGFGPRAGGAGAQATAAPQPAAMRQRHAA